MPQDPRHWTGTKRQCSPDYRAELWGQRSLDSAADAAVGTAAAETATKEADKDTEMQTLKDALSTHPEKALRDVTDARNQAEVAANAAVAEQELLNQKIATLLSEASQAERLRQQALAWQHAEVTFSEARFPMLPQDVA